MFLMRPRPNPNAREGWAKGGQRAGKGRADHMENMHRGLGNLDMPLLDSARSGVVDAQFAQRRIDPMRDDHALLPRHRSTSEVDHAQ